MQGCCLALYANVNNWLLSTVDIVNCRFPPDVLAASRLEDIEAQQVKQLR